MKFDLQRADFWKRISAFLFDSILVGIVIVGVATILSAVFNYGYFIDTTEKIEAEYTERYGLDPDITDEEFNALSEAEKQKYYDCDAARQKDPNLIYAYNVLINLALAIVSCSILIGFILMELVVPIFFKNGQTLGKKAFGLGVMHTNGVRLRGQAHFIRTIIGKCLIETLVPVYFIMMILFGNLGLVGLIVLILFMILELFTVARTRTRSTIHDLVSDTVVVDLSSQMIFENVDELMAYKTKIHAEEVRKKEY